MPRPRFGCAQMASLATRMQRRREAILLRWLEGTFATYSRKTAGFLAGNRDPFANPVGEAIRNGSRGILDALLEGVDPDGVRDVLERIVRIRAIQGFAPSRAVSFVFGLKEAIRDEMGGDVAAEDLWGEMGELDRWIDDVALLAFDMHALCREKVYELRVDEVRRSLRGLWRRGGGS